MALTLAVAGCGGCRDREDAPERAAELVTTELASARGRLEQSQSGPAAPTPATPPPTADLPALPSSAAVPEPEEGTDRVGEAGAELLRRSQASRWSLDGELTDEDLTIEVRTEVTDRRGEVLGEAGFNLSAVLGFQGVPKCNLLAFEIAYRAGMVVPLVGRRVGWGFPSSEMLANDALDGEISEGWAAVRQRPEAETINLDRELGAGFFVVGRARVHGRPGHVAVVDWVEELALDREGEVRVIAFMGWEANTREGARYGRVVFATTQAHPQARFDHVYVLELRPAEPGREVITLGDGPENPTQVLNLEADDARP